MADSAIPSRALRRLAEFGVEKKVSLEGLDEKAVAKAVTDIMVADA
jgi:hypothetical protein